MGDIIRDELNVKELEFSDDAAKYVKYEVKPSIASAALSESFCTGMSTVLTADLSTGERPIEQRTVGTMTAISVRVAIT